MNAPIAFSREKSRIEGDNLVRLVFLDESGRSRSEPFIVVAGVIIHGDHDYRKLETLIQAVAARHLPTEDQDGFVFHASELFSGGRYFTREKWPRGKRCAILRELAGIPKAVGFPVVFGHLDKAEYRQSVVEAVAKHKPKDRAHVTDVAEHMVAFSRCEVAIERRMREFPRDEICMLIAEDTDRVKVPLKEAHRILKNPEAIATVRGLPLTKIVDTPHFAAKRDSSPLQIADVCAFLIMRRLMKREDSQEFFELIAPQLTWRAADFGESMGTEKVGGA